MISYTPLRYPGGKAKIYKTVKEIIKNNNLSQKIYCEPFAGGFGLGLKLLLNGDVHRVIINDYDRHLYAFWMCVFNRTQDLVKKIKHTNITIEEWYKQKEVYNQYQNKSLLDVGFSTLFLNRTNYSGILKGGPIGGLEQKGNYKIDCRFQKNRLIKMIENISKYKNCVEIYNNDAVTLINLLKYKEKDIFYNFDPPYVNKAKDLYLNAFQEKDHIHLYESISNINTQWIVTYDNVELIKDLYKNFPMIEQELGYSVSSKRKVKELVIYNVKRVDFC